MLRSNKLYGLHYIHNQPNMGVGEANFFLPPFPLYMYIYIFISSISFM